VRARIRPSPVLAVSVGRYAAALGVGVLFAGVAHAEAPSNRFSLSWTRLEGASACTSSRALADAVEARLGRTVFLDPHHG